MNFESYLKKHHASSTARRYKDEVARFKVYLERQQKESHQARYRDIVKYISELRKRYANPQTIRCSLHAVQKYYSYQIEKGLRTDNPAKSIRLRDGRTKQIQLQDLFSEEELESLLERKERYGINKNRNQLIIGLLIYQGLRREELVNLKLEDIDLEQAALHIKASRKTNGRSLKLQAKQLFALYKYIHEDRPKLLKLQNQPTFYLLINQRGKLENGEGITYLIESQKHRFKDRKLSAKTIRQSVIANRLRSGYDLREVQVFAGHRYVSSTEKYRVDEEEALKKEVLKYHPLK